MGQDPREGCDEMGKGTHAYKAAGAASGTLNGVIRVRGVPKSGTRARGGSPYGAISA